MDWALFGAFVEQQWLLFAALFIIIVMLVNTHMGDKMSGYASVSPEEAVRLLNDGAFVLDVRTIDEFRTGHLSGAKNISITDLASKLDSLSSHQSGPTLVYCESGMRSSRACAMLKKAGFEQLHNLSGGAAAWRAANLPLAKAGKKK